jgi:hypothetical protein
MDKLVEFIVPLIVIVVFIVRALKAVADKQNEQGSRWSGEEDNSADEQWADWETTVRKAIRPDQQAPATPAPPPLKPAMSAGTGTRPDWDQVTAAKPAPYNARTGSQTAGTHAAVDTAAVYAPSGRRQSEPEPVLETLTSPDADLTRLMGDAIEAAFPAMPLPQITGTRNPDQSGRKIRLQVRGTANLRRGLLWREVLERPRAFDL